MDTSQYLGVFIEESKENLQLMNEVLLELEKNPEEMHYVDEIFRVAHTLKGMSGTMGFNNISELTHEMENLLDEIRDGNLEVDGDLVDLLFDCFDDLEYGIDYIGDNGIEPEEINEDILNQIRTYMGKEKVSEVKTKTSEVELDEHVLRAINKAKENNLNVYEIEVTLDENCLLKAARAFTVFSELEDTGEIIYSRPHVQEIEDEEFDRDFIVIYLTEEEKENIESKLNRVSEVESVKVEEIDAVDIKKEVNKKGKESPKKEPRKKPVKVQKMNKTVRVDIDRLDNLMNLVSELIIIKTRMDDLKLESGDSNVRETIEYLDRITTNIHESVMKVRMVPIERVFNRFPRLVRDLSKDLNKKIKLIMTGEETEVDRTIMDEIGDPLIHLIRNSLDHGIETPDERVALGKPEEGQIKLVAYPDGNNVVIEVEDDGRGIDAEKIKNKALENGMISENEAKNLSDEDSLMLLFEAGLSTTKEVSDISGRGVGLDVVKSKIESINGEIEVRTEQNVGSKFIIRIPLTLAIIQALMIKLGEEIFAIPLNAVAEIITANNQEIENIQGQEVIVYRGKTVPLVRLGEILRCGTCSIREESENRIIVIVNKGDRLAGIIVDDLIGQQEIVIKSLGSYLNDVDYISGATILGDGSISLIIDVNSLI